MRALWSLLLGAIAGLPFYIALDLYQNQDNPFSVFVFLILGVVVAVTCFRLAMGDD